VYAPETLENLSRITDEIKREITTVQGGVATLKESQPEGGKSGRLEEESVSAEEPTGQAGAELGNRYPADSKGQVETVRKQPAPTPDRAVFWKELSRFLGYCPRNTGDDSILLLPEIFDAIAVEIGGFYNFVVEERTSRATLEKLVPTIGPEEAVSLYKRYLFHWERSQARICQRRKYWKLTPVVLEGQRSLT
jgi:hypothetical protein